DAGVCEDLMYRWLRRPSRKSDPNATGRRNPIDYVLRLIRAVYLVTPRGARYIRDCIVSEFARLEAKHGHVEPFDPREAEEDFREIAYRATRRADRFARETR